MSVASGTAGASDDLRPLDVGQSLSAAVELYRRNAVKLWTLTAAIVVPLEIIATIIRRVTLPSDVFLIDGTLYTRTGSSTTIGSIVFPILNLLGTLLVTGALFHLLVDSRLGRPHTVSDSFEFASHKLLSLLWLGIVLTVVVTVGFILLVIPGIFLLVATSVAVPVLMLEGVKGVGAMSRSISLVQGRWWATLGTLLLAFILYAVAAFVLVLIGGALGNGTTNVTLFDIIIGVVVTIGYILFTPFWAAVVTVIYIDLRVRKEGLDRQGLLEASPSAAR